MKKVNNTINIEREQKMNKAYNPLIYIVDDDEVYQNLVRYNLDYHNYSRILAFNSGEKCMKNIDLKPDIILLDYWMDGESGIETLKKIKEQHPEAIVIFLTGNKEKTVAEAAIKHGAYDYLLKNHLSFYKLNTLLERIRSQSN